MVGLIRFPGHSLTLIVKGTFDLAPDEVASIAEQQLAPTGDEYYEDDEEATGSIRYSTDFAYAKPRADLLLVGRCYPPNGQAAAACRTTFQVGEKTSALAVFGQRDWSATQPLPFEYMELRYENSFGGEGYKKNPAGKGIGPLAEGPQQGFYPIPNIEGIDNRITSQGSRPEPAGFGPLAAGWEQRFSKVGTYKGDYKDKRWPWFPEDFDWGYFNAAPQAMQLDGFLRGDEPLYFENLDPQVANFKARLPGVRPRCFLKTARTENQPPEFAEVPLVLDTLWVDMDTRKLVLVWRGWTDVEAEDYPELETLFIAAEWLEKEAGTVEFYNQRMKQVIAELEAAWDPEMEEPAAVQEEVGTAAGQADSDDHDEGYEQLRAMLVEAGIDPDNPPPLSKEAEQEAQRILAKIDQAEEEQVQPDDESQQAGKLTRETVMQRLAQGESLEGEDLSGLDLSGLDMRGAALSLANLEEAKLVNSNLAEADLTGARMKAADLSEADLSSANLAGADMSSVALHSANLTGADLEKARLTGANLAQACLDSAVLEGAAIQLATLTGVSAVEAVFIGADLTGSSLKGGLFEYADFTDAVLERANFDGAKLIQATFERANAAGANMTNTDMTGLRASGGVNFSGACFRQAMAKESNWEAANLTGADFSGAEMEGAYFGSACLERANLDAANMKFSRFPKANLSGATLTRMNLFQGSLEKAQLSGADISGSNMYGVEFLDAAIEGLTGSNVNLKMTKLER